MKNTLLLGSGLAAAVAAFGITSGLISAKDAAIASLFAIPSALTAHIISESKSQKRINESDSKLSKLLKELDIANSRAANFDMCQSMGKQLQAELNKTRDALEIAKQEHQKAFNLSSHLNKVIEGLESQVTVSSEEIEALQTEVEEWESEFVNRVEVAADVKFQLARKIEIDKIFTEHDKITSEAMSITEAFQKWGMKVSQRFQDKNAAIEDTRATYQQNIKEFTSAVTKERDCYLDQIDLLNQRIGQLQHELAGDLVEPEYGQFGYATEGKIANDLARRVWEDLQIPLAVKGYQVKSDGSVDVGYGFSRSMPIDSLLDDLKRHSEVLVRWLGIHKINAIKKHDISELIVLTFRREPSIKSDSVKLIVSSPEEFLDFIATNPIRYRLIADPRQGKTPSTAVMISKLLEVGGTLGNTGTKDKIPHTLITVSCPDVESSQKDKNYPLRTFLKYGNSTASVKSFSDAEADWEYRKRDTNYADNFFQLWVWDELDNTISNADEPAKLGNQFKNFLKQAHHTGIGWIVSGQSVMTSQIPGFKDDDRELFTQIIIGCSKIRKYLEKYGKKIHSSKKVTQLLDNLEVLEDYMEDKNSLVTDEARLLRLALVLHEDTLKLYFLPNLDKVSIDHQKSRAVITLAAKYKEDFARNSSGKCLVQSGSEAQKPVTEGVSESGNCQQFPTMGGVASSGSDCQKPHCCHCGGTDLKVVENGKLYQCSSCKTPSNRPKRFSLSKAVWK